MCESKKSPPPAPLSFAAPCSPYYYKNAGRVTKNKDPRHAKKKVVRGEGLPPPKSQKCPFAANTSLMGANVNKGLKAYSLLIS